MLVHAIAHGGCADTVRESALKAVCESENPLMHRGLEPASVLLLAFLADVIPTELSRTDSINHTTTNKNTRNSDGDCLVA